MALCMAFRGGKDFLWARILIRKKILIGKDFWDVDAAAVAFQSRLHSGGKDSFLAWIIIGKRILTEKDT